MAILIRITKVNEQQDSAVYEFGSADFIIGTVIITKSDGKVTPFNVPLEQAGKLSFYLPRVTRSLLAHHAKNEYPDHADYCA